MTTQGSPVNHHDAVDGLNQSGTIAAPQSQCSGQLVVKAHQTLLAQPPAKTDIVAHSSNQSANTSAIQRQDSGQLVAEARLTQLAK